MELEPFIVRWLCGGRHQWFAPDWSVGLLTAVYYTAEARREMPNAWRISLATDAGYGLVAITIGLN